MPKAFKGRVDENGRECTVCEVYKEWSEYDTNAYSTTGYRAMCSECRRKRANENQKQYAKNNKIKNANREASEYEYRKCSLCDEVKPLSEFVKNASAPTGYMNCCKKCHSERENTRKRNKTETDTLKTKIKYLERVNRLMTDVFIVQHEALKDAEECVSYGLKNTEEVAQRFAEYRDGIITAEELFGEEVFNNE